MAGPLGRAGHLRGRQRRPPPALVHAVHVPVPERCGAHGPRPQLHLRRPHRALPHDEGLRRAVAHGLRQLRPARPRTPPSRPAATRGSSPTSGSSSCAARSCASAPCYDWRRQVTSHSPRVPALDPVDLPAPPRGGPRLPAQRPGQLVPGLPDRAGQRAGPGRRHLRALRGRGRASATSSSGSSRSPTTPSSSSTTSTTSTGPSGSRPCSATGSAAPRAPSSTWPSPTPTARPAPTVPGCGSSPPGPTPASA